MRVKRSKILMSCCACTLALTTMLGSAAADDTVTGPTLVLPPPTTEVSPPVLKSTMPLPPMTPTTAPATAPAAGVPTADAVLKSLLHGTPPDAIDNGENPGDAVATPESPHPAAITKPAVAKVREGQTITNRLGHLAKDEKTGQWIFAFDADDKGVKDPPIELLPSRTLEEMEIMSDNGAKEIQLRLSGEITEYKTKKYLLPSFAPQANAESTKSDGGAGSENVLQGILHSTPETPVPIASAVSSTVTPTGTTAAPNTPALDRVREGENITSRLGRLSKDDKTGQWDFAFEADGKSMKDPPMGLVPCQMLEQMEKISEEGTKPMRFRVSGEVMEYKGKNYLYVHFMKTERDLHQF